MIVEILLCVILVVQLGFRLLTGEPHGRLAGFGNSLAQYVWQLGRYVTGAAEAKPWPFMEWPAADAQWQYQDAKVSVGSAADAVATTPVSAAEHEPPVLQPATDLDEPEADRAADDRPTP